MKNIPQFLKKKSSGENFSKNFLPEPQNCFKFYTFPIPVETTFFATDGLVTTFVIWFSNI